ncbi:laminin subunit alpha-4-like [Amphiura filiformis]|uniref:laminin subunit alpha-4-like n=1 Tax=Amphiura filiformis TaxID=82378 RepID=UPI003B22739F
MMTTLTPTEKCALPLDPIEGVLDPVDKELGVFIGPAGGHVILDPNFSVGVSKEVRLSIKPRSSSGVIFSVKDTPNGDFLSLEIVDGVLYLRCDNGAGEFEASYTPAEGPFFMCDGNWHDIAALKHENTLQLIVDGEEGEIGIGSDRALAVNTNHPFYLGGLPDGVSHRGVRTDDIFVGCIRDIIFDQNLYDFKQVNAVAGDVDLQACPTH